MPKVSIVFEDTDLEAEEFSFVLEGVESDLNDEDANPTMAEWMGVFLFNKAEEFISMLTTNGSLASVLHDEEDDEDDISFESV